MKLLTLNTHSLLEDNYSNKLPWFVDVLLQEKPDLIALQEVNQTMTAPGAQNDELLGFQPAVSGTVVREDNHALSVTKLLRKAGISCSWTWLPVKVGYGRYDEGLAILSLSSKIQMVDAFQISRCSDYQYWKTRKILGVQLQGQQDWFYTVHMGWWNDDEEPFKDQWQRLEQEIQLKKQEMPVWLMGDFNGPAEVRGESYDHIAAAGWYDTYQQAERRDSGLTVKGIIDGWRSRIQNPQTAEGMRIDQIWCSEPAIVQSSNVIYNGNNGPVVSDHFGILIEIEKKPI